MKRHYFDAHARRIYGTGIVLYLLWLLTLTIPERPVFHLLANFADTGSVEAMFLTAGAIVALNMVRAIPLYVSCFYMGEGFGRFGRLLFPIAIPISHYIHGRLTGDPGHYPGMVYSISLVLLLCLQLLIWNVRGVFNRMLALCLFLFSFHWLSLSPALTPFGFGDGELSWSIKTLAGLYELSNVLNMLALGCFSIASAGALLATLLLANMNRSARQFRHLAEQRAQLVALREEALQARMAVEIQTLVHDLRRPLTSITGMVDVMESMSTSSEARECAKCAGAAAASMNIMIEEIMSADGRSLIHADELLDYTMGQISPMPWHTLIRREPGDSVLFRGNKVRISRALVNLMDNAARAVAGGTSPDVCVRYGVKDGFVTFEVSDNGPGLPEDFTPGTSGSGSTGFGVIFVQGVAENHNGSFMLRNKPEGGAQARLSLPLFDGVTEHGGKA